MSGSIGYRIGEAAIAIAGLVLAPVTGGYSAVAAALVIAGIEGGRTLYDTANAPDSVNRQNSIADITLQTSTLGSTIPQIFGQVGGVAGNVFWASDKVAHENREEQSSGKGGGPAQVNITTSYTMSLAIGICDTRLSGPMDALVRMYRNFTLFYDVEQDGSGAIATITISEAGEDFVVGDIGGIEGAEPESGAYQVEAIDGDGGITQLKILNHGTGYAQSGTCLLVPDGGDGANASILVTAVDGGGGITTSSLAQGGTGFAVSDTGTLNGGDTGGTDATYVVSTVTATGRITAYSINDTGSDYHIDNALHRGGGAGHGARIKITGAVVNVLPGNITFYTGAPDQAVDPTMEASIGSGGVPRYPYLCYVVIADENLGQSGQTFSYTFDLTQEASPTVSEVVTILNNAVGLTGDALDVSGLPAGDVNMALVSIQAARAPLQQLAEAYRFYVVESGTALAYREIGTGAIIATIPESDLDVAEETSPGIGLLASRVDDVQLPTELNVTYIDKDQQYQQNTQRQMLAIQTGSVEAPRVETLALVLTPAQAKQIAQEQLNNVWIQRTTLKTTLGIAYAYLEPGDRVTITGRELTYTAVLTETSFGRPGLIEITALRDAAVTRAAVGGAPAVVMQTVQDVAHTVDTTGLLLNLPALNASDVAPRYHVAYIGSTAVWGGAALYRSVDSEASYQQQDLGLLEAFSGTVDTAIADADAHLLDTGTTITVVMRHGTLASISDEALYNGGNQCTLGNEILAFGLADLVDTNTYHLTRLLRGRRGTEWATSTHTDGETLVILDAAVRAVALEASERNVTRDYKTASLGLSLADIESYGFTATGANLNPWSVALPAAMLSGSDWVLTWRYRSRYSGAWHDGGGIGFDFDANGYEVCIYSDNTYVTLKRSTLTTGGTPLDPEAVATWTYDAASQTTDFGSTQSTIYYRVYALTNAGISVADNLVGV